MILKNIKDIVSSTIDSLELILYSYRIIVEQIASQDANTTDPTISLAFCDNSDDKTKQKILEEQRKHKQKYDLEGNLNRVLSSSNNKPLDNSPLRDTRKYFESEHFFYPEALYRVMLQSDYGNSDDMTKNFKHEEDSIIVQFIYHQLFVNIIAQVEEFVFWIFTIILKACPKKLDKMKFCKDDQVCKDDQGNEILFKNIEKYIDNPYPLEDIDKTIEEKIKKKILDDYKNTFNKLTKYLNFEEYPEEHSDFLEKWVKYAERRFRRHAAMHRGWRVNDYENLLKSHNYNEDMKNLNEFCEKKSLNTNFSTIEGSYVFFDEKYFLDTFELAYDIISIIWKVCEKELVPDQFCEDK